MQDGKKETIAENSKSSELREDVEHDAGLKHPHLTVWHLAWPAIALNSMQIVNSLLDAKFIGYLGRDALSASGASVNLVFLLVSLAIALGTATTALVSRFYGAKEHQNLITASRQSLVLSLICGFGFMLLGYLSTPFIAELFSQNDKNVYRNIILYVNPLLLGIPALFLFNAIASALRGIGDTKKPMYISGFQIFIHIILNFLLIFPSRDVTLMGESFVIPGADLGIIGAGWAFSISAWIAAFIYLPVTKFTPLGAMWRIEWIRLDWVLRIFKIAVPAAVSSIIRVTSLGAFSMALAHTSEGPAALGAMRVGFAMEGLAFMPAFGYMIAASALVGQSLGMKKPHRAEKLAWAATNQAVIIMCVMSVLFLIFSYDFARFFVDDPLQMKLAAQYLFIIAITEPFFGYAMVLTGAHQGAGDTVRPTWVALIALWGIRVPLAWIFAVTLGFGTIAAWIAMSFTQLVQGVMMIWHFKRGKWKEKEV